MILSNTISVLKALADSSRLMLLNALMERPQYVEELAERLGLAPSTTSFHLKKLEKANLVRKKKEQYFVVFHINEALLGKTLRELVSIEKIEDKVQQERLTQYRLKVIKNFFQKNRLIKIPVQHKKRRIVLEEIAKRFQPKRVYSETEINRKIKAVFDDHCAIRRYMVEMGIMIREKSRYRLKPLDRKRTATPSWKHKVSSASSKKNVLNERRIKLKKSYKRSLPPMGVFRIENRYNGRWLMGNSLNLPGILNRHRTELRFGSHRIADLQADFDRFGEDNFNFEIIEILEQRTGSSQKYEDDLTALEEKWRTKLGLVPEKAYLWTP